MYLLEKQLGVLNVVVGGCGRTASGIPVPERCSGICAEIVDVGSQCREAYPKEKLFKWIKSKL